MVKAVRIMPPAVAVSGAETQWAVWREERAVAKSGCGS